MACCRAGFRLIGFDFYLLPEVLRSHNQYRVELLVHTEGLATAAVLVVLGNLIVNASQYLVRDLIAALFQVESLVSRVGNCRENNPAFARAMSWV